MSAQTKQLILRFVDPEVVTTMFISMFVGLFMGAMITAVLGTQGAVSLPVAVLAVTIPTIFTSMIGYGIALIVSYATR